jgi:hypothetical protein
MTFDQGENLFLPAFTNAFNFSFFFLEFALFVIGNLEIDIAIES